MKQIYKIHIETWTEFQDKVWLRAFSDFLDMFKEQMESKHKGNNFIYHKKTVDDLMKLESFCTNEYAKKFKEQFTEITIK